MVCYIRRFQAQLKTRLQCKSFQWFLDNIYPENEITSLQDVKALGNFRNEGGKNDSCLDTMARMWVNGTPNPLVKHVGVCDTWVLRFSKRDFQL